MAEVDTVGYFDFIKGENLGMVVPGDDGTLSSLGLVAYSMKIVTKMMLLPPHLVPSGRVACGPQITQVLNRVDQTDVC